MTKVIKDTWGFAHAIQRQFGCDREILEQLVERFSENVVIAGDRYAVATTILKIACQKVLVADDRAPVVDILGQPVAILDRQALAAKLLEDRDIAFDAILGEYRDTNQDEVGYTYYALEEAVLNMYTTWDCEEIVQRNL